MGGRKKHPSPTPCGDQRSRQGRGLGEDAKGRSLGQGRPYAESGSQRSSRALRPPADSPDLPVFPGSAWTPLTYSLCQGMGNRRVNGSNTPGQREKSVCARSASAAHPPSFLPPPPIRAPFSSARREGGGGLYVYVCMHVRVCARARVRFACVWLGAGGVCMLHVLVRVLGVKCIWFAPGRGACVCAGAVCACL